MYNFITDNSALLLNRYVIAIVKRRAKSIMISYSLVILFLFGTGFVNQDEITVESKI